MSFAEDRLLPPIKMVEIFRRTRGKVRKIKFKSGLSSREKAEKLAKGCKEVLAKLDKASSGIKTADHLQSACDYIDRNGKFDLEDENGDVLNASQAREKMESWIKDQDIKADKEDLKRAADARRFIVSCPSGTDPEMVKMAARELGQEIFAAQGFQYVFTVHYKDKDHPKEPEHPHAHFLIKSISKYKKRLNLRKADLRYIRERFAVIAKKYGIDLNATSRAVRGKDERAKTQAQIHEEIRRKKAQSQAQKWAINRKKKNLKEKLHPYDQHRREELVEALKTGKNIEDHPILKKAKKTRQQVKDNANAYISELKNSGKKEDLELAEKLEKTFSKMKDVKSLQQKKLEASKLKIKERLQQKKMQTQAQKWAIERKKKLLKEHRQKASLER